MRRNQTIEALLSPAACPMQFGFSGQGKCRTGGLRAIKAKIFLELRRNLLLFVFQSCKRTGNANARRREAPKKRSLRKGTGRHRTSRPSSLPPRALPRSSVDGAEAPFSPPTLAFSAPKGVQAPGRGEVTTLPRNPNPRRRGGPFGKGEVRRTPSVRRRSRSRPAATRPRGRTSGPRRLGPLPRSPGP